MILILVKTKSKLEILQQQQARFWLEDPILFNNRALHPHPHKAYSQEVSKSKLPETHRNLISCSNSKQGSGLKILSWMYSTTAEVCLICIRIHTKHIGLWSLFFHYLYLIGRVEPCSRSDGRISCQLGAKFAGRLRSPNTVSRE